MKTGFKVAALGLLVAMAAPANAVTITKIEVRNTQPSFLQIAELQLFQALTGTNVALASNLATASGTSFSSPQDSPSFAIDGDTGGDYFNDGIFHSQTSNASEVFTLILSQAFDVSSLKIFGRTDGFSSRDQYSYTLFNGASIVGTGTLDARVGPATAIFGSVSAVPEPSAWALMLLGFGVVGSALRSSKRRQKLTVRYS